MIDTGSDGKSWAVAGFRHNCRLFRLCVSDPTSSVLLIIPVKKMEASRTFLRGRVTLKNDPVSLSLTATSIDFVMENEAASVSWMEVLGAVEEPGLQASAFSVLLYRRFSFQVAFSQRLTFTCKDARQWVAHIQSLLLLKRLHQKEDPIPRKRFLVFINPASGDGSALAKWSSVYHFFEACDADILVTGRPKHASEVVSSYDLSTIDTILTVGGDGLLHEVLNGLCSRPDSSEALKTPVCVIPAGSGNAVSAAICYEAGVQMSLVNCALMAVKGTQRRVDVTRVRFQSGNVQYCIRAVEWANSVTRRDKSGDVERPKFLDGWKAYFSTLWQLVRFRKHPGSFAYWDESGLHTLTGSYVFFAACNVPFLSDSLVVAPNSKTDDGFNDVLAINGSKAGRMSLSRVLFPEEGAPLPTSRFDYYKTRKWTLRPQSRLGQLLIDGEVRTIAEIPRGRNRGRGGRWDDGHARTAGETVIERVLLCCWD